uniref:Cycloviolacin-O25 n=1 Tax=Viola odorata TaxID=97441 RepID=CYO25_VIOOD|nr:RecName: Full=Cycloviolacin-O25 [Viola odorata]
DIFCGETCAFIPCITHVPGTCSCKSKVCYFN